MSDRVQPVPETPERAVAERAVAERAAPDRRAAERSVAERATDHAAIADSIDELLPALIAKLGATGLAELEVREDALRVRLRRPDGGATHDRRAADRAGRGDRARGPVGTSSTLGSGPAAVGPGHDGREYAAHGATQRETVHRDGDGRDAASRHAGPRDDRRAVATSPAVGIYQPRADARAGTKVRAGDRLGTVDMLGVPLEVVAPTDGLIGASLVEPGEAVEYGQELVVIEFPSASGPAATSPAATPAAPTPAASPSLSATADR